MKHQDTDRGPMQLEGSELRLRAMLPPGAAEHLRELVESLYKEPVRTPKIRGAQKLEEIPDPVIASAFEMADQDLADLAKAFAADEARRQQSAQPTDSEKMINAAYRRLRDVVLAARKAGIKFKLEIEE